jgi:WD40 repeat protein
MRTRSISLTLLSRSISRWGATSSKRRAVFGVLAITAFLVVPWLAYRWWTQWPTQAILRTSGDTWPLAFSPDSRMFATSGRGGITLWESDTGRRRTTWDFDASRFAGVGAFAPDGRTFAVALFKHPQPLAIALVDVASGRMRAILPTRHTGVYDLSFAGGGRTLRAFLGDVPDLKEVVRWDVETGNETSSQRLTCPTSGFDTEISPDGRFLAVAPFGGTVVRIWDVDADREFTRLTNPRTSEKLARGLGFSRDGKMLVTSREDGSFEIWDLESQRLRTVLRGHTGNYVSNGIRLAPDGRTLASRGEYLRPSSLSGSLQLAFTRAMAGRTWRPAPEVIVLDLKTGKRLARAASAIHPFYSPDSSTIATRETDYSVRLRPSPAEPRSP